MRKFLVAGAAAVALMAPVALAQDAVLTSEPERRELEVAIGSAEVAAQQLIGSTVVDRSGEPVGTIIDLQLASATAGMPGSTESEIQSGVAPPQEDAASTDPAAGAGSSPDTQPAADVSEEASDEVEKVIIRLDGGSASADASPGAGVETATASDTAPGESSTPGTSTATEAAGATGGAKPFPKLTGRVVAVDPAQLEPEQGGTNRFALGMDEAQLQAAEQFQYEEGSEYFTMMEAESGSTQQ